MIQTQDLTKVYGQLHAIDNLTIDLVEGDLFVVLGDALAEHDLEHALTTTVGRAVDQGDEMRGDDDRRGIDRTETALE